MIARPPIAVPLSAGLVLAVLTVLLIVEPTIVAQVDGPLSERLRGYAADRPALVTVLRYATDLAATVSFVAAGVAATVLFALRRERTRAWFCGVVTVVVPAGWFAGQWLLHRPRPVDGFITVAANGFPSGHTTNAAAVAVAVVLLAWPGASRRGRLLVVTLVGLGAGFIGATRLLLLAHWPVDVIGGCLLAVLLVSLVARWVPGPSGPPAPPVTPPGKVSSRDGSCEVRRS
ncbi:MULTISPECIES: phosphatase PAP2 family protein [unclassified Solwaraspora]|uniref:phosphatase PAP2 family protein n=1 Tax=unclassified Solwaraspora TaxID=2627926 RepID=UPI00259B3FE4|nr:phosphatase PAP2 family protein [Solwaraspora sp. WMMA2056]WJK43488.1 phosphatase PAP2 family protein [Solwaraspora sp. WMMA2056]